MMVSASVPGRVCLAGEDLDWMGGQSVQLAVELRTTAEAQLRPARGASRPIAERIRLEDANGRDLRYPLAALTRIEAETGPSEGAVGLTSRLPSASGLGSSAAVLTATLAAASAALGLDWSPLRLAEVAYEVELELTNGCVGPMDQVACVRGGVTCLTFRDDDWELAGDGTGIPPGALLVANTGHEHVTASSIKRKKDRWFRGEDAIVTYHAVADSAALEMAQLLRRHPVYGPKIGALMNHCHDALSRHLGVSSGHVDDLARTALAAGAWGAKLCGSGEGGAVVALVPEHRVVDVTRSLSAAGVAVARTRLADRGLVLEQLPGSAQR